MRSYSRDPDIFPKMAKTYDAYEKDIAVVQVPNSSALQYRLGVVDYGQ